MAHRSIEEIGQTGAAWVTETELARLIKIALAARAHLDHTSSYCLSRYDDDVTCPTWAQLRAALGS